MDRLDEIKRKVAHLRKSLESLESVVELALKEAESDDIKSEEGVEGTFNGIDFVGDDGKTYNIPANYAAKSRLVCGDRLKMVDKDGKNFYKQLEKVERKTITGIVSRKEGDWFILADSGSYKILDNAAEFNELSINDEVEAFIPAHDLKAPYAAFEKVVESASTDDESKDTKPEKKPEANAKPATPKKPEAKVESKKVVEKKPVESKKVDTSKKSEPEPVEDKKVETEEKPKPEPKEEKMSIAEYDPRVVTDHDLR